MEIATPVAASPRRGKKGKPEAPDSGERYPAPARGLSDWLLRIHVKEASFMLSAGSLAVAPIAMAFFFDTVEWSTAFFVGYSYDSFLDLFLQRFEGVVSAATKTIKV